MIFVWNSQVATNLVQSVHPLCSKGILDQQAKKALIPIVVLNPPNPIYSLYTWPTMVSDIGKPLKLPQTTFLTRPRNTKKHYFQAFVSCAAANF